MSLQKIPLGITPLLAVMVCAVSGASFFAYHSLAGPEIGLTKAQRRPFYEGQNYNFPDRRRTKLTLRFIYLVEDLEDLFSPF